MVKNDSLWLTFNQSMQCVVQFMVKFSYWLKHGKSDQYLTTVAYLTVGYQFAMGARHAK
jgi:hypothetical protein